MKFSTKVEYTYEMVNGIEHVKTYIGGVEQIQDKIVFFSEDCVENSIGEEKKRE